MSRFVGRPEAALWKADRIGVDRSFRNANQTEVRWPTITLNRHPTVDLIQARQPTTIMLDMDAPLLKQFGDLDRADFDAHPVWVACHTMDYDAPWYEDTDEETFRPWTEALPVDPNDGMFLVRAAVTFADASDGEGFLTPALEPGDIGTIQPHVFVGDRMFGFWGGMFDVRSEVQSEFLDLIGKPANQIFPIRFQGQPGLSKGAVDAEVVGWLRASP